MKIFGRKEEPIRRAEVGKMIQISLQVTDEVERDNDQAANKTFTEYGKQWRKLTPAEQKTAEQAIKRHGGL